MDAVRTSGDFSPPLVLSRNAEISISGRIEEILNY